MLIEDYIKESKKFCIIYLGHQIETIEKLSTFVNKLNEKYTINFYLKHNSMYKDIINCPSTNENFTFSYEIIYNLLVKNDPLEEIEKLINSNI